MDLMCVCIVSGWWLVENEEKRLAWFPAPYLEKLDDDDDGDEDDTNGTFERGKCKDILSVVLYPSIWLICMSSTWLI